jgi:hypothetical protein
VQLRTGSSDIQQTGLCVHNNLFILIKIDVLQQTVIASHFHLSLISVRKQGAFPSGALDSYFGQGLKDIVSSRQLGTHKLVVIAAIETFYLKIPVLRAS